MCVLKYGIFCRTPQLPCLGRSLLSIHEHINSRPTSLRFHRIPVQFFLFWPLVYLYIKQYGASIVEPVTKCQPTLLHSNRKVTIEHCASAYVMVLPALWLHPNNLSSQHFWSVLKYLFKVRGFYFNTNRTCAKWLPRCSVTSVMSTADQIGPYAATNMNVVSCRRNAGTKQ